jgi:acyl-CoA dehydrogenase
VRAQVRHFVETEIKPFVDGWIDSGKGYPMTLHEKAYKLGFAGSIFPNEFGGSADSHDFFHRVILWDELARCGGGMAFAALSVNSMALPPVLFAGTEELKQRVAPGVVRGEKFIVLAVSEATAGSDVSNLQTTAVKQPDGSWLINGSKKWCAVGRASRAGLTSGACARRWAGSPARPRLITFWWPPAPARKGPG